MKLYYTSDCNYCAIAVNALSAYGADCMLLPHVGHQEEVQDIGDGIVPFLVDEEDVVFGSRSIASHLSGKFDLLTEKNKANAPCESELKLYVTTDCDYCMIVINALASQGVDCMLLAKEAHQDAFAALGDGVTVPLMQHGDTVITGASEIVAYLNQNFERKHFPKVEEKPKDWNISYQEMKVRYFTGFALTLYGWVGGLPADYLSYINVNFWAMDFFVPMMGTLNPVVGYGLMAIGSVLLWTAATRKCPIYSMMGINKNEIKDKSEE